MYMKYNSKDKKKTKITKFVIRKRIDKNPKDSKFNKFRKRKKNRIF